MQILTAQLPCSTEADSQASIMYTEIDTKIAGAQDEN